jgi:hypothetical protein
MVRKAKEPAWWDDERLQDSCFRAVHDALKEAGVHAAAMGIRQDSVWILVGRSSDVLRNGPFCPSLSLSFSMRTHFEAADIARAARAVQDALDHSSIAPYRNKWLKEMVDTPPK